MIRVYSLLFDYTFQVVALGSMFLGLASGVIGSFAVLRKQSLLGDGVSHAALPGVVLAFLLLGNKETEVLLLGAFVVGLIATGCIKLMTKYLSVKFDSALALVLSVFFGLGMVLLTYAQKFSGANQAGLSKFIFGQASTILKRDVIFMGMCSLIICIFVSVFWKELKLVTFDFDFFFHSGFMGKWLEFGFIIMYVMAIVIGLQMVGVILMSAMLVAPAVAARQWTNKLLWMVVLASFFGMLAGILGALLSSIVNKLPTGPTIVIILSLFVLFSILFAPRRGIVSRYYVQRKYSLINKEGTCTR